ncbi:hypothetical protein Tco_0840795 [Tanacetum coccineum]|uniref:Uncharacterized protein n=1 Tax=Tanacetum coccineum TaxID=301880 RepID=A0ABQ5AYG7_9ASTR
MYPRFLQLFLNNQITLAEPFNDVYQTPAHTKKVFTNMKRKGKDFSGRVTPLFASMLAPPVVEGEGSGQPSEPQPAPSTAQPRIEEQIPFPHTSVSIPNVAEEAVFKEWDDRVVRATTIAASLDAVRDSGNKPRCQEAMGGVIAQTRSERSSKHSYDSPLPGGNTPGSDEERIEQDDLMDFIPPTPYDSPLSGGHTPGSDEGRPNINELMVICTNLSNRVLALEQSKTAQDLVIRKLKKKVRKLEKKLRARTLGMKLFKIGTSKRKSLDEECVSKQGRKSDKTKPMFDSQFNTASIDVSVAGPLNVSIADPSTSTVGDIFEEIQKLYEKEQKWIKDFIPMDSEEGGKKAASSKKRPRAEPDEESVKRQKIGETLGSGEEQSAEKEKELSEEELHKLLVVVPVEEVYVEALQVKYPIIDWEVYSEDTRRYWRIIRVGNHTEAYQIFADMLKKFDRDDLVKLWDLVKKRFSTTEPTDDKEKELWVELKRLFEPDNDDILWKLQRYMHDPLVWRLYDTCGVHHVSSVRGHDIFMLVEKEYPLTRGTLGLMMVARLLVEADSEMSRELLRKIFYQANRPRQ